MTEFRNPGCNPAHDYVPEDEIKRIRARWYGEYKGHGDCVTITAAEHLITATMRDCIARGMTSENVAAFVQEFAASVFSTLFPKGLELADGTLHPLNTLRITIMRLNQNGHPEFFEDFAGEVVKH